jgi:hypothetical protein
MSENSKLTELYQRKEEQRKLRAKRPIAEKMAIAEKLRDAERTLAPTRAANKAKRAAGKMEIRIKTA